MSERKKKIDSISLNGAETFNVVDGEFKVSRKGYRHQQCFVMFICLTIAYSMRACIGVALVGMNVHNDSIAIQPNCTNFLNSTNDNDTENFASGNETNSSVNITCKAEDTIKVTELNYTDVDGGFLFVGPFPKFIWPKHTRDVVISSFFWGYMLLQLPAGHLVYKFGPRLLMVMALTINCVISFSFPWAAYYGGWIFAAICRFAQGLSQAFIIPSMFGFFGQWAPLEERSRLIGFAQGGQAVGTVLGITVTGFIAESSQGWPGIFRFYGILSGLAAVLVFVMIRDTPAQHSKISLAERRYIEDGLGLKCGAKKKKLQVPWRQLLRSRGVWAIVIVHISQTWGQVTLFTEIPSFMDKVMRVNIKANGVLTALPFLVMWFTNFFFNWFIDWIIIKKYMSVTKARKLANSLGSVPPAIGLVILAFSPKTVPVVEGLLIFICAFKIASHVGSFVCHVDITPNFASTTMSMSNFVSNLVGSQAPVITGYIIGEEEGSEERWRIVFFVSAALYFFMNLAFVLMGTAERAEWNEPPKDDDLDLPEAETMIKFTDEEKTIKP